MLPYQHPLKTRLRATRPSGIALVTSIGSLGGFVGPSIIGAVAKGPGGIYRGFAVAGVSLFVSATFATFLPKKTGAALPFPDELSRRLKRDTHRDTH